MTSAFRKLAKSQSLVLVFYLVFLVSIIGSFRAVSSIGIGVLLLAAVISNPSGWKSLARWKPQNTFLAGCVLLFLLQLASILYSDHPSDGWGQVRIKTALVITPLVVCISSFINNETRKTILSHYSLLIAAAAVYCLGLSCLKFAHTNDTGVFFYHALVQPLDQHAIYFSLLVMLGLVFLLEGILKGEWAGDRFLPVSLAIFLSVFLFLLSSRLVISFYLVYLVSRFPAVYQSGSIKKTAIAGLAIAGILLLTLTITTRNPISRRFYEIIEGNIGVVGQDHFKQGDYFNGLQFRLLQWKFVAAILDEKASWTAGVGAGDAQAALNEKYISMGLYSGTPERGDRGYLVYNTHNQFLQTLLQNGIVGLLPLLLISLSLLKMAAVKKSRFGWVITSLLLAWLFTESAFETQYGIMIFSFFPLLILSEDARPTPVKNQFPNPPDL